MFGRRRVPMWELPAEAWEQFLVDGNGSALLARVRALPTRPTPRDVDYPEFHRLRDIDLEGQAYRVSRLIDLDDGQERLFIHATAVACLDVPGVPYWLRGPALARWVQEEAANP